MRPKSFVVLRTHKNPSADPELFDLMALPGDTLGFHTIKGCLHLKKIFLKGRIYRISPFRAAVAHLNVGQIYKD